jgi:hypothetical protein
MELNEEQFIAGFNSGYLMAIYEPRILGTILKDIRPINSYILGLSSGQREYDLLQTKNQSDELEGLRQKNRDQRDRERD